MEQRVLGGRYLLKDKVGTGGMATVFRAQDQVLDRTVAVKIMLPQYAGDATFAARFKQEAQAAAGLSSPYIVGVYDWGKDGDTYYICLLYTSLRGVCGSRARGTGVSRSAGTRRSARARICTGVRGGSLPRGRIGTRGHAVCGRRRARSNDGGCLPAPRHARALRDARARSRRPARRRACLPHNRRAHHA